MWCEVDAAYVVQTEYPPQYNNFTDGLFLQIVHVQINIAILCRLPDRDCWSNCWTSCQLRLILEPPVTNSIILTVQIQRHNRCATKVNINIITAFSLDAFLLPLFSKLFGG